jgi:hypothetical protein
VLSEGSVTVGADTTKPIDTSTVAVIAPPEPVYTKLAVLVITLLAGAAAWDAPETDNSAIAKPAIFVLVFMFISLYLVVGWLVL